MEDQNGGRSMDLRRRFAQTLAFVGLLGMIGSPVWGATPINRAAQKQIVHDVKLTSHHELVGQVVHGTGTPAPRTKLFVKQLRSDRQYVVRTDGKGTFRLKVEQTGVFRISVKDQSFLVRAWQPELAPPVAKTSILCVTGTAVRGQAAGGGLTSALTNPWVIGATIAAAVAIPVAIVESQDDDESPGAPAS